MICGVAVCNQTDSESRSAKGEFVFKCAGKPVDYGDRCAGLSWRDPAGGRPARGRGRARLVTSVAGASVTALVKRTQ